MFKASTQYNDMIGSSALDHAGRNNIESYLKNKKLIAQNEICVGFIFHHHHDLAPNLSPSKNATDVNLDCYIATGQWHENKNISELKKVKLEIPIEDFLGLFKCLSVTFSKLGCLEGKDI